MRPDAPLPGGPPSSGTPPDLSPLGERELDCMAVLWELGSGTVTEVLGHLGVPLAYTTVLTVLRNLEAKQYLRRESEGRGHRYFPRVARQAAQQSALSRVVSSFFGGSPEALIARLVEERSVSPDELARLARELNANASPYPSPHPSPYPSPHASPYKSDAPVDRISDDRVDRTSDDAGGAGLEGDA